MMILKNVLYASTLACIVSLSGCKGGISDSLHNPEKRQLYEGTYQGRVDGRAARYIVEKEKCVFITEQKVSLPYGWEIRTMIIRDVGCDNIADSAPDQYGFLQNRNYFVQNGTIEDLDSLLEKGQDLVCKENRIKE